MVQQSLEDDGSGGDIALWSNHRERDDSHGLWQRSMRTYPLEPWRLSGSNRILSRWQRCSHMRHKVRCSMLISAPHCTVTQVVAHYLDGHRRTHPSMWSKV